MRYFSNDIQTNISLNALHDETKRYKEMLDLLISERKTRVKNKTGMLDVHMIRLSSMYGDVLIGLRDLEDDLIDEVSE